MGEEQKAMENGQATECCICAEGRFDKKGRRLSKPWQDKQKVVYIDKEGKGYCLFHAPAEHKGMSVHEFNKRVFARIQDVLDLKDKKARCDLSGTIFPECILFPEGYKFPDIDFVGSTFQGKAGFDGSTFQGNAGFNQSTFKGGAWFNNSTFQGNAWFYSSTFQGDAWFEKSTFQGNAWFKDSTFQMDAGFYQSTFKGGAGFYQSTFQGNAWFKDSSFEKGASFESIKILDNPKTKYKAQLVFADCTVSKDITFQDCNQAQGYDQSRLNLIGQYELERFRFDNSPWEKGGKIQVDTEDEENKEGEKYRLQSTRDFYQRMKAKYKNENNEYEASKWHEAEKRVQLKLLWQKFWGKLFLLWHQFVYWICAKLEFLQKKPWKIITNVCFFPFYLIRWMLQKFALGISIFILCLYKYSSGYGECPARAIFWLSILLLLPLIFSGDPREYIPLMSQFSPDKPPVILNVYHSLWDADLQSIINQAVADNSQKLTLLQSFGRITWQILITIQASLLAFAVRNNFRR